MFLSWFRGCSVAFHIMYIPFHFHFCAPIVDISAQSTKVSTVAEAKGGIYTPQVIAMVSTLTAACFVVVVSRRRGDKLLCKSYIYIYGRHCVQ